MSSRVTEKQARTLAKLISYRLFSVITSLILTLAFGGTPMQALMMAGAGLVIGSIHYYSYERLWLWIKWGRDENGVDSPTRSIVKSVIYRITVLFVMMAVARMIFISDNFTAFLLALTKFVANAITYFVLERIFNKIEWGKIKK